MIALGGISVPDDVEAKYNPEMYPHWHVYLCMQIGAPMPHPRAHWDNAKIIAGIPAERLKMMSYADIIEAGFLC